MTPTPGGEITTSEVWVPEPEETVEETTEEKKEETNEVEK